MNEIELTARESAALLKWAGVDLTKCLGLDGKPCPLQIAGSNRNVIRAAEHWGPKLVAMLAEAFNLQPGDNPEDALFGLFEDARREDGR